MAKEGHQTHSLIFQARLKTFSVLEKKKTLLIISEICCNQLKAFPNSQTCCKKTHKKSLLCFAWITACRAHVVLEGGDLSASLKIHTLLFMS